MRRGVLEGASRFSPLQTSREGAASPFPLAKEKLGGGGGPLVPAGADRKVGKGTGDLEGQTEATWPSATSICEQDLSPGPATSEGC